MASRGGKGRGRPAKKKAAGAAAAKARPRAAKKGSPRAAGRAAVQKRRRRRDITRGLIVAAILLVLGGFLVYSAATRGRAARGIQERLEAGPGGCRYDTRHDGTAAEQGRHITGATYRVDPPAGGAHSATPAAPGFYSADEAPPDDQLVHAMEHGFVVLWHRPDVAPEDLEAIEALSDRFGRELIVVPRSSLEGEITVTAWHRRLLCERLDTEAVALFTTSFKDQGPEKGFL